MVMPMRPRFTYLLSVALFVGGCATALPPDGPRIQRLSAEEADRIGVALPKPVTLDEIVSMSRAGAPPDTIIQRMRETASVYRLNQLEIVRLQEAGVAQSVIDHMTAHQRQEEALAHERAAREAAWARSYASPWGWGHYDPWIHPGWSIGTFKSRGRFGYGAQFGAPWGWWW